MRDDWERQMPGVALVIVESPYRALTGPFLAYLDVLDQAWPPDTEAPITFVVIPEYVPRHWWERILYNQSTNQLRRALLGRPNTVITNVPYRREEPAVLRAARPAGRPRAVGRARELNRPRRHRRHAPRSRPGGIVSADGRHPSRRTSPGPTIVDPEVALAPWPRSPSCSSLALSSRCNGGPCDDRIVRLVVEAARPTKSEVVAIHVVEIDWTLPLDASVAERSESAQRVLDTAEAAAEHLRRQLEPVLVQARDVGAAIVDEAVEREADLLVVGLPYRKKFGGDFAIGADRALCPQERAVRRCARADASGYRRIKVEIVGCAGSGGCWPLRLRRGPQRHHHGPAGPSVLPASRHVGRRGGSATARTRTRSGGRARRGPTISWPDRG